jgi:hypothetical protein
MGEVIGWVGGVLDERCTPLAEYAARRAAYTLREVTLSTSGVQHKFPRKGGSLTIGISNLAERSNTVNSVLAMELSSQPHLQGMARRI